MLEAFKNSFNEGNKYALSTRVHKAQVFKSTRPENISCGQENEGKPIVCSAFNLNATFDFMRVVGSGFYVTRLVYDMGGTMHVADGTCFIQRPSCDRHV